MVAHIVSLIACYKESIIVNYFMASAVEYQEVR